jgi:Fur family ferric uptake transcriptional regulator
VGTPAALDAAVRSLPAVRADETEFRRRATALLHSAGERATRARLEVLGVLTGSGSHLSAAEIHRRLQVRGSRVNLSTVYRIVSALVEHDLAHLVAVNGENTYGLALRRHHHVVCDRCGSVSSLDDDLVRSLVDLAGNAAGLQQGTVELHGVCAGCAHD